MGGYYTCRQWDAGWIDDDRRGTHIEESLCCMELHHHTWYGSVNRQHVRDW